MKVVVVTGASRGLGRAIALRFGKDRVVLLYQKSQNEARQLAEEIEDRGGQAFLRTLDVGSPHLVRAVMGEVAERWGGVDILINNAGVVKDALLLKMDDAQWDRVVKTNLCGPFHLMREAAPLMKKRGGGHIINIGSLSGLKGRQGQINYAAAKGGLWGLTTAAARELGPHNIKVNMVIPGLLDTDMGRQVGPLVRARIMNSLCLGRTSSIDEVADFIHHLSCMEHVSGQLFNLDSRVVEEA